MSEFQELNSRIDRIEVTLTHAVDAIEKIATVINRPQATKWGPILTAVGLLLMAMASYTTLITLPIERDATRLQEELHHVMERELETQRAIGRIEGQLGRTE